MTRSDRRRAWLGLGMLLALAPGATACAFVSGLDGLEKVSCLDVCGDASIADASFRAEGGDAAARSDASGPEAGTDAGPSAPPIRRVQLLVPGWQQSAQISVAVGETAGNLLVAAVYGVNAASTDAVSDTLHNAWKSTPAQANANAGCNGTVVQIFYAEMIAGGENTVTVEQATTDGLGVFLLEYSGIRMGAALDGVTGAVPTSNSATMTAGALTTSGPVDVVMALFADGQSGSGLMQAGIGFSGTTDEGFYSLVEDALPIAGPATITPAATQPNVGQANCWAAAAAAFKGD